MATGNDQRHFQIVDFWIVAACLLGAAVFSPYPLSYVCVVGPALVPLYLWLAAGAPGLPTLPIVASLSIIYYAAPLLRGNKFYDEPIEAGFAAITVGSFLICATIVYSIMLKSAAMRRYPSKAQSATDDRGIVALAFVGLASGIVFYLVEYSALFDWLDTFIGLARAVALTLSSIGCYLVGTARARGLLREGRWIAAVLGVSVVVVFAINGLLLVGGVMNILAAILGYVVAARRIPWLTLVLTFALISVFQAGKDQIRERYELGSEISLLGLPGVVLEWTEDGVDTLWSGGQQIDVLERASLLDTLIKIQQATPDIVPYLNGETYELLPSIILPRFIEPDKVRSQAGLNLLAVRYGFEPEEGTNKTTIGFGLIAEAYANFGSGGVLVVGALFGFICGLITWLSSTAPPVSLRMLTSIAATSVLLNLEADLSYLIVTMLQSVGGVLIAASLPFAAGMLGRRPIVEPALQAKTAASRIAS
jgi:hypothetical protein